MQRALDQVAQSPNGDALPQPASQNAAIVIEHRILKGLFIKIMEMIQLTDMLDELVVGIKISQVHRA